MKRLGIGLVLRFNMASTIARFYAARVAQEPEWR